MATYNFKPDASKYHINLHRASLAASILYDKNRGKDTSENENELEQLNKFYGFKTKNHV
jgi:hypothetical protein